MRKNGGVFLRIIVLLGLLGILGVNAVAEGGGPMPEPGQHSAAGPISI